MRGRAGGKLRCLVDDPQTESSFLLADLKAIRPELTALYAVTFHPQFETNRRMYVCYIIGNDLEDGTFVSEFTVDRAAQPQLIGDSERVIIRWWAGGHNGCCLKFGPDGMLYISTGDGGAPSPPDPLMAGQDVSNLLSCILRIDVDRPGSERAYTVPADNPFVGMQDVRPEIWAFGFRNPWRMSFDPATGDLWVGDVGWQRWEMVYRVERGGNYGWPIMEGPQTAVPDAKRGPAPVLPPVMSHPHSERLPLQVDLSTEEKSFLHSRGLMSMVIFSRSPVGFADGWSKVGWHAELAQTPLQLVGFAEDRNGELLLIDYQRSHQLYRLEVNEPAVTEQEFPKLLSETGLFEDVQEQRPAAGVRRMASMLKSGLTGPALNAGWRSRVLSPFTIGHQITGSFPMARCSRRPSVLKLSVMLSPCGLVSRRRYCIGNPEHGDLTRIFGTLSKQMLNSCRPLVRFGQ